MEQLITLHHWIFVFLIFIFVFVAWIIANILHDFYYLGGKVYKKIGLLMRLQMFRVNRIAHGTELEIVWTILPSIILLLIAVPSFTLLYAMEVPTYAPITLKAIGHQWYWQYEMVDRDEWPAPDWVVALGRRHGRFVTTAVAEGILSIDSNMTYDDELRLRRG